jgi:SAM-dependent methyltransferase
MMRSVLRSVVPQRVRQSRAAAGVRGFLSRNGLAHDWIYDAGYYARRVEAPAVESAASIADSIVDELRPRSVVDVGCGTGALLEVLRERGCDVFGFEYSKAALEYCRRRRLAVAKFDLEKDVLHDDRAFDVAVSMEVAEHLPATVADRYVDLLVRVSDTVVFTAAIPGQGGNDHVNEQPPEYWIGKFARRGFRLDDARTRRWREAWEAGGKVQDWYHKNLMIFRAEQR